MPNGSKGDHPLTDLFYHNLSVFSPTIEALLREIHDLAGTSEWHRMEESINWFRLPPDEELEQQLRTLRDRLRHEAKERGWEVT
jgi:hypothetical protein